MSKLWENKHGGFQSSLKPNANNCWMRKQQTKGYQQPLSSFIRQTGKDFNKKEPNSRRKKFIIFYFQSPFLAINPAIYLHFQALYLFSKTLGIKNKINFQPPLKKLQWSATANKLNMPLAGSQFQYYIFIHIGGTRHIFYRDIYEKIYTYLCIQVTHVRRVTWEVLPRLVSAGPPKPLPGAAGTT